MDNFQKEWMKLIGIYLGVCACLLTANASPVNGYMNTPILPSGWHVHDGTRPQPVVVVPSEQVGGAPSDALVLFDGTNLSQWVGVKQPNPKRKKYNKDGTALWSVTNGYMQCTPTGDILTKQAFGDCQLHIEWQSENPPKGDGQNRGNSGVFFMTRYEVQVLDVYNNRTYADGTTGAVYGQTPPLVNACRKPGEWQVYDIVFQAPRFKSNQLVSPPYVTVFLNGILVQNKTEVLGTTSFKKLPPMTRHAEMLPIKLQDHNNLMRFRNIWIRPLDLAASDSKTASP